MALKFISTHTPHARRDALTTASVASGTKFQLTRLMRGVTQPYNSMREIQSLFQLTRLMRGVTG